MRISTAGQFDQSVTALLGASARQSRTQLELSTGRRLLTPSDDPVAATRVLRIGQDIAVRERYVQNIDAAVSALSFSESVIDQSGNVLQRVRELALQAGSGITTAEDRRFIAAELTTRLDELVGLANTRNASGEYLYAGFDSATRPFVPDALGGYVYQGDQGQRALQVSASTQTAVSDSGQRVFVDVPTSAPTFVVHGHPGNDPGGAAAISGGSVVDPARLAALHPDRLEITFNAPEAVVPAEPNFTVRRVSDGSIVDGLAGVGYSAGAEIVIGGMAMTITGAPQAGDRFLVETTDRQGILTTVDRLRSGLQTLSDNPADASRLTALIEASINDIDAGIGHLLEVRAEIGARLNTVEGTRDLHQDVDLLAKGVLSDLQDLDFAEAASRLSLQSFLVEASMQSFARISRLNLFSVLG